MFTVQWWWWGWTVVKHGPGAVGTVAAVGAVVVVLVRAVRFPVWSIAVQRTVRSVCLSAEAGDG